MSAQSIEENICKYNWTDLSETPDEAGFAHSCISYQHYFEEVIVILHGHNYLRNRVSSVH